jgi:hypothetical protein
MDIKYGDKLNRAVGYQTEQFASLFFWTAKVLY